jgi:hypothetical protein
MEFMVGAMNDMFGKNFDGEMYKHILESAREYGPDTRVLFTVDPKSYKLKVEMVFPLVDIDR